MKLNKLYIPTLVAGSLVSLTACDLVKDFSYKVSPNPLEMHGDSVKFSATVTVPEKGLNKKAKAEITAKLGTYAVGTWVVQGEKVTGNGQTITFKPGGTATFEQTVPYRPEMEATELKLTGKVFKGTKEKGDIPETKLADGTIITPLLVRKDFKMLFEKGTLAGPTEKSTAATINYEKAKSVVRPNEIKDKDILDLQAWLKAAETNPKIQIVSIDIKGYASPDGVEDKNQFLSSDRTRSARTAIVDLMKKAKMMTWTDTTKYTLEGQGEDFVGFKDQLAITTTINEADKNLFIRILEMTKDPVQREKDMVNLGKSYTELEKDVFPKIRRAVITVKYKEMGLTEEEIIATAKSNPSSLSIEELLYAGDNLTDLNEKATVYRAATEKFPSDFRAHNNLGAVLYEMNKISDAKKSLETASNLKDNSMTKNNLAGIALLSGDKALTKKLLGQAKGGDVKSSVVIASNNAAIDIMEGRYAAAESNSKLGGFNKALALTLLNKLEEAKKVLDAEKEAADVHYLKAIIAARSGQGADAVVNHLKSAFAMDERFKAKAAKDREFLKLFKDSAFSSAVR